MSHNASNESREKFRSGRVNQKLRTRKELLAAAGRLVARGNKRPSIDEVAREAMVSRATIYRYFPNFDALLLEAPLDEQTRSPEELFEDLPAETSAADRVARVQSHLFDVVANREAHFRMFLKASMEQWLNADGRLDKPLRGARRLAMLETALAPLRKNLDRAARQRLIYALSMLVSIEPFIALRDVCGLDPKKARSVAAWAARTLVEAATVDPATPVHRKRKAAGGC